MENRIGLDGALTLAFSVRDRKASARWYEKVLGFEVVLDSDEMGWIELATGIPGITVGFSEVEEPQASGAVVPTFGVADIEAARAGMEAQGVRFDGPTHTIEGMVSLATFYDPDGHALMLAEDLERG